MPTYFVYHQTGSLTKEQRQAIAKSIVDVHTSHRAGVPRHSVKVIFHGCEEDAMYSGDVPNARMLQVHANIPAPRSITRGNLNRLATSLVAQLAVHAPELQDGIAVRLDQKAEEQIITKVKPSSGSVEELKKEDQLEAPSQRTSLVARRWPALLNRWGYRA